MGVDGTVGGLHNLHPSAAVRLFKAFRRGDYAAAQREQDALVDLVDIFAVAGIWDSFQDAMRYLGLAERIAGEPYLGTITEEQSLRIRAIMQRHVQPVNASLRAISEGRTSSSRSIPIEA
jgi:4-hydroxy-tetrahydrodipicolinate synthase